MSKNNSGQRSLAVACGGFCAVLAVGMVFTVSADEFMWQGTASDVLSLADPGSYKVNGATATRLPGASDTIAFEPDKYAVVTNDTIDVLNGVKSVWLQARSRIVFNVTTNAEVKVPMSSLKANGDLPLRGTIEKNGTNELSFTSISDDFLYGSQNQHADYYCERIKVNAGILKIQSTYDSTYSQKIFILGELEVAENATLFPPQPGWIYTRGLIGDGLVTNDCTIAGQLLRIQSGPFTFGGVLAGGYMTSGLQVTGQQTFTGTESSMDFGTLFVDSGTQVTGHVGLVSFGATRDSSGSIGRGDLQFRSNGGRILYLGPGGETTSRQLYIQGNHCVPNTMDAGPNGGVTFTGQWYGGTALAAFGGINLILDGSNTAECVLNNNIVDSVLKSEKDNTNQWYMQTRPFSLTKRGTGAWYAKSIARTFSGLVIVENGTLAFGSLAPAGTACSLGVATSLYCTAASVYEPFWGQDLATATPVGYAIRLGDPSDSTQEGTFEYRGTAAVDCSTRPIAVTGRGRLLSTGGEFKFAGVSPFRDGENVLTLDGTRIDSVLRDVTNNVGNLSIVKKGTGTWMLAGNQSFTGDITVEEGALKLGAQYDYYVLNFRLVDTNAPGYKSGSATKHIKMREFGLFSDDGERCNANLEWVGKEWNDAFGIDSITPGTVDYYTRPGAVHTGSEHVNASYIPPDKLVDNDSSTFFFAVGPSKMLNQNEFNSSQWLRVVMRLDDGAKTPTSLDLLPYDYTGSGAKDPAYAPISWSVQGIVEGFDSVLTTLFETNGLTPSVYTDNKWFSNGDSFNTTASHTGFMFDPVPPGFAVLSLPTVRSLCVKTNAEFIVYGDTALSVSNLVVDVAGMGTVKGVSLASSGTVDLVGDFPANGCMIPADLSGLDGYDSLAAGWAFTHNGGSMRKYSARFVGGGIAVNVKGFTFILR